MYSINHSEQILVFSHTQPLKETLIRKAILYGDSEADSLGMDGQTVWKAMYVV